MSYRAPLRLDEFFARMGWTPGTDEFGEQAASEHGRFDAVLRGDPAEAVASTCTELVPSPQVIWDANGYYRAHGFSWPYRGITRGMLMKAHHARGIEDPWLTYALKQLCHPGVRQAYDLTPLGEPFLADIWVQAALKAKAAKAASRLNADLARDEQVITPEEILAALGMVLNQPEDAGQDPSSTPPAELSETPATVTTPWTWAYYQLRSSCDDTDRLGRWQELLLEACDRVGTRFAFAVGFVGRQPHDWVVGEVHGHRIVLLNDRIEPTSELAARAVASIIDEGA